MIDDIHDDLDRIVDLARWAHGYAYGKAGRGLDAERGTDLSRSAEEKELAAPTYDLEIGDHTARTAYQFGCLVIWRAYVSAATAAYEDGVTTQPVAPHVDLYSHPLQLVDIARRIHWLLDRINTERHKRQLAHMRQQFDKAVRRLNSALSAGEAQGIAHGEKPCKTCGIRPQAEREKPDGTKRAAAAGECDTCATWRRRNGTVRPKELDTGPLNEARAAQARRMARGEGWGAA